MAMAINMTNIVFVVFMYVLSLVMFSIPNRRNSFIPFAHRQSDIFKSASTGARKLVASERIIVCFVKIRIFQDLLDDKSFKFVC